MPVRLKIPAVILSALGLAAACLPALFPAQAELLPVKTYTTADGLAQNNINRIVFDSRGFIWFCTNEGLSRFDGYKFTNYGIEQGLPHRNVNDLLETSSGDYWLATSGGLVRFNPKGAANKPGAPPSTDRNLMFSLQATANGKQDYLFTSIVQDQAGEIWCGSETGLFRLARIDGDYSLIPTELWSRDNQKFHVYSLFVDHDGVIWAGSFCKIFRLLPDGKIEEYAICEKTSDVEALKLYEDRAGKIWVGTGKGMLELEPHPKPGAAIVKRIISNTEGLPGAMVRDIWQALDNAYWVATDRGLCKFFLSASGQIQSMAVYTKDNGLSDYYIKRVAGDPYGNLWIGTANAGVMKWFFDGFTTFGHQDGVSAAVSVRENKAGELFVAGYIPENNLSGSAQGRQTSRNSTALHWRLGRFDNDRFVWIRPNVPGNVRFSVGWNQFSFQDSQGEWWIATQSGLFRFPKVARFEDLADVRPKAVYTTQNGLSNNHVARLFEDSRGDIWIASSSRESNGLDRWERATERIHNLSRTEGMQSLKNRPVVAFCEDQHGNIWLGLSNKLLPGSLARYRHGVATVYDEDDGAPKCSVFDLLIDAEGRLWIASINEGASRVDDPGSEHPKFASYSTANGLSSNRITSLAEDNFGRIYFGAGKGVDQLDLKTGNIRHFSNADGLPLGSVDDILRDRKGNLWFATTQGFSRFIPKPDPPSSPPPILIDNVRIRGQSHSISALGETDVRLPALNTGDNQIEIEYVGLSFAPGDSLNYQCKLEGIDPDWRAQTKQRSINFANLAPGAYRFLVRAVNANGIASQTPASVSFTVAAPVWRRWWFIALMAGVAGGLTYAAYRYRLAELLALERMRTRIATDLHDEVGSSLSQIAILSEVARQRLTHNGEKTKDAATVTRALEPIEKVAATSREAVDAMSDIVWAINPQRDQLSDLTQRMRRFASDTLTARDIALRFHAPQQDLSLDAEVRRQIFLIFKECINNIVRHAEATEVEVDFALADHRLSLRVRDNGRGFAETEPQSGKNGGNGLLSMRKRAVEFGGTLEVISAAGTGTTAKLEAPLRPRKNP
ncbi:MAG: two-component regulator propeller domain-containing protein [Blastocatellales bacterium]